MPYLSLHKKHVADFSIKQGVSKVWQLNNVSQIEPRLILVATSKLSK